MILNGTMSCSHLALNQVTRASVRVSLQLEPASAPIPWFTTAKVFDLDAGRPMDFRPRSAHSHASVNLSPVSLPLCLARFSFGVCRDFYVESCAPRAQSETALLSIEKGAAPFAISPSETIRSKRGSRTSES